MSETIAQQVKELAGIKLHVAEMPNGKYKLPDNTILRVRDGKYEHIGHRDKKEQRKFLKMSEEDLRRLLQLPGFGSHKEKTLAKLNKIELANLMNPKPVVYFLFPWVDAAYDSKAKKIKSLMQRAVVLEKPQYREDRHE